MDEEDQRLERLLAHGYLSGSQYDEIERKVLKRSTKPRSMAALAWGVPAGIVGSCLVAFLLIHTPGEAPFTPKGGAESAIGVIDVGCGRADHVCKAGDTLMFSVNTAVASGHLGAYAERLGAGKQDRIGYFPTAGGSTPRVARTGGTVVLPEGVRIGPEHTPGRYRVHVWVSRRPLSGPELENVEPGLSLARSSLEIAVIP
jgi:hypothetical protein